MKHKLANHMAFAVLAGAALAVTSGSATAEEEMGAYSMAVVVDAAQGRAVHNGKYEKAIARLTESKRRHRDQFARHTNLCVAYTKTGNLEKAETACQEAVTLYEDNKIGTERNHAVALSNRGVLHAVKGDVELARADFEAATELYRFVRITRDNLARVEMEMATQG